MVKRRSKAEQESKQPPLPLKVKIDDPDKKKIGIMKLIGKKVDYHVKGDLTEKESGYVIDVDKGAIEISGPFLSGGPGTWIRLCTIEWIREQTA